MQSQISWQGGDPYAALVAWVDGLCMSFYGHVRRNARRITRIVIALLPLMMLLVGSCKTSQLPSAYGGNAGPEQFRAAMFPDSVNFRGASYYPAAGYIVRAQTYVAGTPQTLTLLTDKEVGYLFGKPAMQRKDAGARVWQYKTKACVVDFYFYQDPAHTADSAVSYVDLRGRNAAEIVSDRSRADCLGSIVDEGDFSSAGI